MEKGVTKVVYGGWYQRTTLHLSEVYEFFLNGRSKLDLKKSKLRQFQKRLGIKSVKRVMGNLEYVYAQTSSGIEIKYYEDGLYVLELSSKNYDIKKSKDILSNYFKEKFQPAIEYIFSMGAPTPKILANIKIDHPVLIGVVTESPSSLKFSSLKYGKVYGKYTSKNVNVFKTKDYIFVATVPSKKEYLSNIIEMQIFFREFKDQLERYLNIHRVVWEEIAKIKEKKFIQGQDIADYRNKLESYRKTISLISNRINQMNSYASTRASISGNMKIQDELLKLFQYRFEDLFDTLNYIKEIWGMTLDYVNSAINRIIELEGKATSKSIHSIQALATVGVVSGILGYLTRDTVPVLSKTGLFYIVALLAIGLAIDKTIRYFAKKKKYKISFVERSREI